MKLEEVLSAAGGDWGGVERLSATVRLGCANNYLLLEKTLPNGDVGVYNIPHIPADQIPAFNAWLAQQPKTLPPVPPPTATTPYWTSNAVATACVVPQQYLDNVTKQWPILFQVSALYNLQDRDVLAGMLGIIGHETGHRFWSIHEFGSATDFDRYGRSSLGQDYGGRGLIQTTWKQNYVALQNYLLIHLGLKYDLDNNPDLLLNDPTLAAHAVCEYWIEHANGVIVDFCKQHRWDEVIHYVWGLNDPGNPVFDSYLAEVEQTTSYLLMR